MPRLLAEPESTRGRKQRACRRVSALQGNHRACRALALLPLASQAPRRTLCSGLRELSWRSRRTQVDLVSTSSDLCKGDY